MAETITAVSGRTVSYHEESLPEAYESRASYGAPDWQVEAWVSTYTAIAAGEFAEVTGDVEAVCGHPATPLAEVVRRRAAVLSPVSPQLLGVLALALSADRADPKNPSS